MQPEAADDGAADGETGITEIAEGPALSLLGSISILTVITLLVAAASECAAESLQRFACNTYTERSFRMATGVCICRRLHCCGC